MKLGGVRLCEHSPCRLKVTFYKKNLLLNTFISNVYSF